jgi:starch synthase (maltosyl-transferring)
MFLVRLALAALSVGNWGIYGPAMELLEATPREPGSEEYLDSEKYEIKRWKIDAPESLAPFIRRLNEIRRTEPSLSRVRPPLVQAIDDPHLLAWCRHDLVSGNRVLVVVDMHPGEPRSATITLDLRALGLEGVEVLHAHDLLDDGHAELAWPIDAITILCTPEEPVRVFRIEPADDATPTTQAP